MGSNSKCQFAKLGQIKRGDITLFSGKGGIFASGVTTHKLHNQPLATKLWGRNDKGETWEYIYFLEEIKNQHIPYIQLNRAMPKLKGGVHKDNFIIQRFIVLNETQSRSLFNSFDLESETFVEEISDDDYLKLLAQMENLDETEAEFLTKRRKEQGYLKKHLFGSKTIGICACCQKEFPVSYLVAAHIKKRSKCSIREKKDLNVVMPMCKFGCDELFEKGDIAVYAGQFVRRRKISSTPTIETYIRQIDGNFCKYYNDKTEAYFKWHFDGNI